MSSPLVIYILVLCFVFIRKLQTLSAFRIVRLIILTKERTSILSAAYTHIFHIGQQQLIGSKDPDDGQRQNSDEQKKKETQDMRFNWDRRQRSRDSEHSAHQ